MSFCIKADYIEQEYEVEQLLNKLNRKATELKVDEELDKGAVSSLFDVIRENAKVEGREVTYNDVNALKEYLGQRFGDDEEKTFDELKEKIKAEIRKSQEKIFKNVEDFICEQDTKFMLIQTNYKNNAELRSFIIVDKRKDEFEDEIRRAIQSISTDISFTVEDAPSNRNGVKFCIVDDDDDDGDYVHEIKRGVMPILEKDLDLVFGEAEEAEETEEAEAGEAEEAGEKGTKAKFKKFVEYFEGSCFEEGCVLEHKSLHDILRDGEYGFGQNSFALVTPNQNVSFEWDYDQNMYKYLQTHDPPNNPPFQNMRTVRPGGDMSLWENKNDKVKMDWELKYRDGVGLGEIIKQGEIDIIGKQCIASVDEEISIEIFGDYGITNFGRWKSKFHSKKYAFVTPLSDPSIASNPNVPFVRVYCDGDEYSYYNLSFPRLVYFTFKKEKFELEGRDDNVVPEELRKFDDKDLDVLKLYFDKTLHVCTLDGDFSNNTLLNLLCFRDGEEAAFQRKFFPPSHIRQYVYKDEKTVIENIKDLTKNSVDQSKKKIEVDSEISLIEPYMYIPLMGEMQNPLYPKFERMEDIWKNYPKFGNVVVWTSGSVKVVSVQLCNMTEKEEAANLRLSHYAYRVCEKFWNDEEFKTKLRSVSLSLRCKNQFFVLFEFDSFELHYMEYSEKIDLKIKKNVFTSLSYNYEEIERSITVQESDEEKNKIERNFRIDGGKLKCFKRSDLSSDFEESCLCPIDQYRCELENEEKSVIIMLIFSKNRFGLLVDDNISSLQRFVEVFYVFKGPHISFLFNDNYHVKDFLKNFSDIVSFSIDVERVSDNASNFDMFRNADVFNNYHLNESSSASEVNKSCRPDNIFTVCYNCHAINFSQNGKDFYSNNDAFGKVCKRCYTNHGNETNDKQSPQCNMFLNYAVKTKAMSSRTYKINTIGCVQQGPGTLPNLDYEKYNFYSFLGTADGPYTRKAYRRMTNMNSEDLSYVEKIKALTDYKLSKAWNDMLESCCGKDIELYTAPSDVSLKNLAPKGKDVAKIIKIKSWNNKEEERVGKNNDYFAAFCEEFFKKSIVNPDQLGTLHMLMYWNCKENNFLPDIRTLDMREYLSSVEKKRFGIYFDETYSICFVQDRLTPKQIFVIWFVLMLYQKKIIPGIYDNDVSKSHLSKSRLSEMRTLYRKEVGLRIYNVAKNILRRGIDSGIEKFNTDTIKDLNNIYRNYFRVEISAESYSALLENMMPIVCKLCFQLKLFNILNILYVIQEIASYEWVSLLQSFDADKLREAVETDRGLPLKQQLFDKESEVIDTIFVCETFINRLSILLISLKIYLERKEKNDVSKFIIACEERMRSEKRLSSLNCTTAASYVQNFSFDSDFMDFIIQSPYPYCCRGDKSKDYSNYSDTLQGTELKRDAEDFSKNLVVMCPSDKKLTEKFALYDPTYFIDVYEDSVCRRIFGIYKFAVYIKNETESISMRIFSLRKLQKEDKYVFDEEEITDLDSHVKDYKIIKNTYNNVYKNKRSGREDASGDIIGHNGSSLFVSLKPKYTETVECNGKEYSIEGRGDESRRYLEKVTLQLPQLTIGNNDTARNSLIYFVKSNIKKINEFIIENQCAEQVIEKVRDMDKYEFVMKFDFNEEKEWKEEYLKKLHPNDLRTIVDVLIDEFQMTENYLYDYNLVVFENLGNDCRYKEPKYQDYGDVQRKPSNSPQRLIKSQKFDFLYTKELVKTISRNEFEESYKCKKETHIISAATTDDNKEEKLRSLSVFNNITPRQALEIMVNGGVFGNFAQDDKDEIFESFDSIPFYKSGPRSNDVDYADEDEDRSGYRNSQGVYIPGTPPESSSEETE